MSQPLEQLLPRHLAESLTRMARESNIDPDNLLSEIVTDAIRRNHSAVDVSVERAVRDLSSLSPNELVDPKTASRRLKISTSKLAAMRCKGNGPKYVKLGARTVYYRVRDLEEFINGRIVRSTSQ